MDIANAILAFLTAGSRTGYDLKKLFVQSESLAWSGNSNQVYRALVDLHARDLVRLDVELPKAGPAGKVYSITVNGENHLRSAVLSCAELPAHRLPIMVHLMAGDLLTEAELEGLLGAYIEAIDARLLMLREHDRRGTSGPSFGSNRQRMVWAAINGRPLALVTAERDWADQLRTALASNYQEAKP